MWNWLLIRKLHIDFFAANSYYFILFFPDNLSRSILFMRLKLPVLQVKSHSFLTLKVDFQSSISHCFISYFSQYILLLTPIFNSKFAWITCKITFISATKNWILTLHFFLFYLLFLPIYSLAYPYFNSKFTRITRKITFISATKNWILTLHFFLFYLLYLPIFYRELPYFWV